MERLLRFAVPLAAVLALACGSTQVASPPDAAAPSDASVDHATPADAGHADAAPDAGVAKDATVDATPDAAPDADASVADAPPDAAPDAPAESGPTGPCSVSRDVFHVAGQPGGPVTYTNLGTSWGVSMDPYLDVMVELGSGPAGEIEVYTTIDGGPLQPGVYPQGPSATGPSVVVTLGDAFCSPSSGTLDVQTLVTAPSDAGAGPTVESLALTFDVVCGTSTLTGCMQYSPGPDAPEDAGLPSLDAGTDAPAPLVPCLGGGYRMVVVGPNGPQVISGAEGTWSAGLTSESSLDVKVLANRDWQITASSDFVSGSFLEAGTTYTSTPTNNLPYLAYEANGAGCPALPKGSFTIVDLSSTGGDQADVNKVLLWWDATCNDAGVTGCLSYGE